jgi:hypothetical protein
MRACPRYLSLACAAIAAAGAAPHAQVVRGTVVARGDSTPLSSAVVVLLDQAGAIRARALTDEHGQFSLRIGEPAELRLRAMRIGWRPTTTPARMWAGDTTVVLVMSDTPVDLPAVIVHEEPRCNFRPDSALALSAMWDDARTALLAAAITREQSRFRFDIVDYVRTFDIASGELRDVHTADAQWNNTRTWVSLPPDQLRRDGYVIEHNDSTAFVAPDIETLLSPYFIETHCFRLAAGAGSDSLVAIEFIPASDFGHAEVRGKLWLDRRSHELRAVDFRYSNVIAADSMAGGRVEFARLPTGAWVMTEWSIRAPLLRAISEQHASVRSPIPVLSRRGVPRSNGGPMLESKQRIVADQLRVYGGTLRDVWRDSAVIWSQPPRTLDVHVTRGVARAAPLGDETIIYLPGTGLAVPLDSTGSAHVDGLVRGAYLVNVGTRQLDVLGWPRAQAQVEIGHTAREYAEFNLADPLNAARIVCGDDAKLMSERTAVLIGTVMRGADPQAHRDVTVSWSAAVDDAQHVVQVVTRKVQTLAGDGRFIACGVPRNRPLTVRVDSTNAVATTLVAANQVVGIVMLSIAP